jgi:hypothetical protein
LQVLVQPCTPKADQYFESTEQLLESVGASIRSLRTGLCLSVEAGKTNDGAEVISWACDGKPSE